MQAVDLMDSARDLSENLHQAGILTSFLQQGEASVFPGSSVSESRDY
jgi:hypothetical protein